MDSRSETLSPSPSRTKGKNGGRVQFAGPPPPITSSVVLPQRPANGRDGQFGRGANSASLDGAGRNASPSATTLIRSRRGSGGGGVIDPLLGLERRERAIQRELQELLDAQSAGLVQGLGGAGDESASEGGSSTPTYNSTRSRSAGRREGSGAVIPVRQPKKKTISLRGARRGLLRDIGELSMIKGEEVGVLADSIAQRENVLQKVAEWEERIQSFQKQLFSSSSSAASPEDEEGRELAELKNEEKAVENEIREMEDRLAQMRARRKWIQERVREGENRREARLSSYRGALSEVEGEVREFLKRPPIFTASPSLSLEEDSFKTLPVNRRTLGMARELWTREISSLQTRQAVVENEKAALEQGAKMWSDSINAVIEFENGLRKQMAGDMQDTEMLTVQVRKMGKVIEGLERSLRVAESRGWNLLICALGAELEAFREGEGILKGALGIGEGTDADGTVGGGEFGGVDGGGDEVDRETRGNGLEEMNGLQDREKGIEREESVESEDDGPNLAELLVDNSHVDGDGDNSID